VQTGLGSRMAMLIGALTGAVAASVCALLVGVGRWRIKRLRDMQAVAPGLVACEPLDYDQGILRTAADCARFDHALVAVLALPGAEDDLDRTFDDLQMALYRDGSRPFRIDTIDVVHAFAEERRRSAMRPSDMPVSQQNGHAPPDGPSSRLRVDIPALGMPKRAVDLDRAQADTLLIKGDAEPKVLRLIGGRADAILLVARARKTTLGQLARAAAALGEGRQPVVIISKPEPKPEPKLVDSDDKEIGAAALEEPSILPPSIGATPSTTAAEVPPHAAVVTDEESPRWRPSPRPRPAMVGAATGNGSAPVELTHPMDVADPIPSSNGNGHNGAAANGSPAKVILTKPAAHSTGRSDTTAMPEPGPAGSGKSEDGHEAGPDTGAAGAGSSGDSSAR
jgi:hypothetical protein